MSLFLKPFGEALSEALQPLKEAVSDPAEMENLLSELGWKIDIDNSTIVFVANSFQTVTDLIDDAIVLFEDIQKKSGNELQNTIALAQKIKAFFDTVKTYDASSTPNIPAPMDQAGFWTAIAETLPPYLVTNYLKENQPFFYGMFLAIGVIETSDEVPGGAFAAYQVNYKKCTIDISRFGEFLTDTPLLLKNLYHWNDPNVPFDHHKLLYNLEQFALGMRLLVTRDTPLKSLYTNSGFFTDQQVENQDIEALSVPIISGQPVKNTGRIEVGALLMPIPKTPGVNAVPDGLFLTPIAEGSIGSNIPLTPELALLLNAEFQGTGVFGIKIFPDGANIDTNISNGLIVADLRLTGKPRDPETPWILIGAKDQSRIELDGFEASLGVHGILNDIEVVVGLGTSENAKMRFVLQPGSGDSFINKIFGTTPIELEWDGLAQWSSKYGFGIQGHLGFEINLPIHKQLGPLLLDDITIRFGGRSYGSAITLGVNAKLDIGPVKAVVEDIGVELIVKKKAPNESAGILGNIDLDFGFKPPKGLGLSIKSDTVTGAGFLSFDKEAGRYVGALELSIKKQITIKIIGILTTKLPNNQPGYSLLLVVAVEGFKPIQLGFGFTLNGVGGLIALHRRMNTDELRKGVQNNTIDNILFPANPVENINSIISSLETVFPVEEGRYSFGPMAIIGWGTPTLITAELGLFFEMPNPQEFALIGVIRALLPDENKALLRLQIAFAGIISFDKKLITFDASLFDSSLLGMTLSGNMAFRLKWGDQPTFVLTVGGFHPKFTIPQLNLPEMHRITLNLSGEDNPRLTLSTYFAVTSNTAQFGARVDFFWEISDKIDISGYLGFDALFFFSPFRFTATLAGGLDVKWKGDSKVSLSFSGTLEGPTPWFIRGTVSFEIFGISYSKSLDKQIGGYEHTILEDINVLPLLTAALQDKKNWQATMAQDVPLLVTVRELSTNPGDLVMHPQGTIAVSQKVVPLDLTISRFGNRNPATYNNFSIAVNYSQSNATGLAKTNLKEYFAPNEFYALSEDERLARESFELMTSGVQVANTSNALTSGAYHTIKQEYETIYMDSRYKPVWYTINSLIDDTTYYSMRAGGSAATSPLGSTQGGRSSAGTPAVTVSGNQFAIAQTHNLAHYNNLTAGSETEALVLLESILETNPELEGKLNVIHAFELA